MSNIFNASNNATIPDVFIIESLDSVDEDYNLYEGRILSDTLRLSAKDPKYFYYQTIEELNSLAALFEASHFRYLHLTMHGDVDRVYVGGDELSYEEFFMPFIGKLQGKRLFCSACLLGNKDFATAAINANDKINAIVAPCDTIRFDVSAAFWAAFYTACFVEDEDSITDNIVIEKVNDLSRVFDLDLFIATNNNGILETNTYESGHKSCLGKWAKVFGSDNLVTDYSINIL